MRKEGKETFQEATQEITLRPGEELLALELFARDLTLEMAEFGIEASIQRFIQQPTRRSHFQEWN